MAKTWAILTPDNIIGNVVISDSDEFLKSHEDWKNFEHIDITDLDPQPAVMWKYENGKFIKPRHLLPEKEAHILEGEEYWEANN